MAIAKTAMLARVKKALNEPTTRMDTELNLWIDRGARQASALGRSDIVKETVTTRYKQMVYDLTNDFIEVHSVIADTSGRGLTRLSDIRQSDTALSNFSSTNAVTEGFYYWGNQLFLYPMVVTDSFVIGSSNKVIILTLNGSPVTFTLTEGTYTATTLAAEMVDKIDDSAGGIYVNFSTTTGKFTMGDVDEPPLLESYVDTGSTIGDTIGLTADQAGSTITSDKCIPVGTVDVYGYQAVASYGGAGSETLPDYLQNATLDYTLSCAYTKLGRHQMAGIHMQKFMGMINQYRADVYDTIKLTDSLDQFKYQDRTQIIGG